MKRANYLMAGVILAGGWLGLTWAADLGTITFTRSVGMGISATAGTNTSIQNVNQTAMQCRPQGANCTGNGADGTFTNTSDPFVAKTDCSGGVATEHCQARFEPGLPDAFDTLAIKDNQFGAKGVPCGPGDPNFDAVNGFPYDCNSAGTIYQIVPKGMLDVNNPNTAACSTVNTSIAAASVNPCGATPRSADLANVRNAPPGSLIVGAPFQVYSSYKSGTRRIHHIEDGFQQADSNVNGGPEQVTNCAGCTGGGATSGGTITRQLFVIDVTTDATGHITDDGTGNIRANGTYILEMNDQHRQGFCGVPVAFTTGQVNGAAQQSAGLGSFRSGDDLSPTGAGLLIAANGRKDCFDNGGNPCPTGRVLDLIETNFCPGAFFPGP